MIKIMILEDDSAYVLKIQEFLNRYFSNAKLEFSAHSYDNAVEFLENYDMETDICLMDIQMKGMNGMEAAKELRKIDSYVSIIFVTNMPQYALQGYEVGARYYILKPLEYNNFSMKLDSVIAGLAPKQNQYLYLKGKEGVSKINVSEIMYISTNGHKLYIHTKNQIYPKRMKLQEVEEKLHDKRFAACSKSYLINMDYITNMDKTAVYIGKEYIPISRSKHKEFANTVMLYFGGRLV